MILDFLFPQRCTNCNRIIEAEKIICEVCTNQISFTHWSFCEDNLLKKRCSLLFPVEQAFALMHFDENNLSRKIIHDLKYKGREKNGKTLAEWTFEHLDFQNKTPDLLVDVPLHPKKQKERGYNQLHLFTETLSEKTKIPYDHNIIKRNFYKKAQALKDKEHRSETENLFSLTKEISGKHILLIDDVFTTGNTISAIAWEILKNQSNKVSVLVIAID